MRRLLRRSGWVLGGIALLVVLLGGGVMIAGNTDAGRAWIERQTFRLTAGHVKLSGLGGSFPTALTLRQLQLIDRDGVWLSADDIAVQWSPLRLLDRRIEVETLRAATLRIERTPLSDGKGGKASVPYIEVGSFDVQRVELGAALTGSAVTLSARGRVRLRSLEDANVDLAVRRLDGDGEYTLQLKFDPKRMDASLAAHEPASGPLENLLSLPGLGALTAMATLAGPRNDERLQLALTAGDLQARIDGHVNLDRRSGDLEYSLTAPAMAPRPDLQWAKLALQGNFHGPLNAPTAEGRLELEKLRIAGDTFIPVLNATLLAKDGRATARATVTGLEIPGAQPRFFAAAPVKIDASIDLDATARPLELVAVHPLLSARGTAQTAADKNGRLLVDLQVKVPSLAPFQAFTGQSLDGSAVLDAHLAHRPTDDSLSTEATLNLGAGTVGGFALLGPRVGVLLSADLTPETLKIDTLRISGRALTLAASGSARRTNVASAVRRDANPLARFVKDLQARWKLDLADLRGLSGDLAGQLAMSGRVSGTPASLTADADVTSRLSVRGSPLGTVTATLQARGLPSQPSATLQAHGDFDGAPLTVDAALERRGRDALHLLVRRAEWKSARIDGDATIDAAMTEGTGRLNLQVGQLGDFDRFTGTHLTGSAQGRLGFVPAQGHSQADLHLDLTDLTVGGFAGNAHLQASGVMDAVAIQLNADAPNVYGQPATLNSAAVLNLDTRVLHLDSASLGYRGQTVRLLAPARIALANGLSVDDLNFGAQEAVLDLKGSLAPTLDLRASLLQVKPDLINAFSPGLLATGLLEGRARLQGTLSSPTGRVRIEATDIRFADDAATGLPGLDLRARADLAGDSTTLNATLGAGGASQMTASGTVPLTQAGALDLKIGGKLDLALANPFLEARGMRATGDITADATIKGTTAEPVVDGGLSLAKGTLRDYARGVDLTEITAEVVGREGALQIKNFKATAAPGSIAMTGTLGVLQPGMPVDLRITAKNAQPIASNIVTANLDADLGVKGMLRQRLDVTGTVHVNRANIGIPNSLPPEVAVLDVRRRGKPAPATAGAQLVIGIALTIEAPREILVQGRGLDAEMGGTITLSGTSDALLAAGGLDLQRGSFSLAGNKLTFDPGSKISFDGAGLHKKIDPTLDFTAHTTLGSTTATLTITGFADAPKFEFSSTPMLPQDQILAQLLFGQSAASLSALQAAELGAALASLSGVGGGGPGVLSKLQKTLGLDRLSVGANNTSNATGTESSGAAVAAGRYVSKRIYIEGKQSTTGTSQVQVDVDLTKHLKLQTRLGNGSAITQGTTPENDPGSSIGLSYQFEY